MACKDCLHYNVCNMYDGPYISAHPNHTCKYFTDKQLVFFLPCKIGETVYYLNDIADKELCSGCENYYEGGMGDYPSCEKTRYGFRPAECIEIIEIVADRDFILKYYDDFNKKIFLTKEEAEAKLKERKTNDL